MRTAIALLSQFRQWARHAVVSPRRETMSFAPGPGDARSDADRDTALVLYWMGRDGC